MTLLDGNATPLAPLAFKRRRIDKRLERARTWLDKWSRATETGRRIMVRRLSVLKAPQLAAIMVEAHELGDADDKQFALEICAMIAREEI